MADPSRTAGGPAGTTFTGPIRTTRDTNDASSAGFPTAIAALGPWCKQNMPSNTTAFCSIAEVAAVTGWVAHKAGSVVGVTMSRNTVNTTGTWAVRVKKNGALLFNTANVSARSVQFYQSLLSSFPFVAGDRLNVKMVTGATYANVTGDFAGWIWIQ